MYKRLGDAELEQLDAHMDFVYGEGGLKFLTFMLVQIKHLTFRYLYGLL